MKTKLIQLSRFGFWFLLITSFQAYAQPGQSNKNKNKPSQECAGNCFSAEVLKAEPGEGGCTKYEMRVSHDGTCRYDLSHFVVEIPCGNVSNVSNSGNYPQVFGKDPTTGLTGLKIDNVANFGKSTPNFFIVKFTWCNNSSCNPQIGCWQPRVAFKAATCVDYDTASVTCQPTQTNTLKATVQKQNVKCSGDANGSILVTVDGGQAPYAYAWSTGCTASSIQNLPAGTYTVTITDSNGKSITKTEEITATSAIVLSATSANPTCAGNANGSIDLTALGGMTPYTYKWSNGATSQDLANVLAGSYSVTVTDSIGCSAAATFQLNNPAILISAATVRPACSQANGQVDITVSGGVEPYSYQWTNGATSQDLTGLAAGSYTVLVTDANQCSSMASYSLQENNTLHIAFTVTPTACVGNNIGAIDITVTGGTAPYSYLWANGATTEDLSALASGIQRLTVTDANGCRATSIVNVFKQGFQVASQALPPTCSGESNGSIALTPNGVPPYTYLWSTGETASSISQLSNGLYSVTVTDNTGCSQSLNFFLSNPVITTLAMVTNPQCGTQGAFAINLIVSGGAAPYTYQWSNGATTEDISGLNSGTYTVTVTDANGCNKVVDVVVAPVVVDWACLINPPAKSPVCGSSGNALNTSVTNADAYSWTVESDDGHWAITSGQNSPAVVFVAGGAGSSATFFLTITRNGCTQSCSYTMTGCSPTMTCGVSSIAALAPASAATAASTIQSKTQETGQSLETTKAGFRLAAYPNPIVDKLSIDWTADANEYVRLDLEDVYGKTVAELFSGPVHEGENYQVELNANALTDRLYIYRYSSGTRTVHGKLLKR
jgi:hypothetical protein